MKVLTDNYQYSQAATLNENKWPFCENDRPFCREYAYEIKEYFLAAREELSNSKYRQALLFFFFNRVTFSGTTRAGGFSAAARCFKLTMQFGCKVDIFIKPPGRKLRGSMIHLPPSQLEAV